MKTPRFFVLGIVLVMVFGLTVSANAQTNINNFTYTTEGYSYDSDMHSIFASTFEGEYRLPDWNNLVKHYQGGGDMNQWTNLLDSSRKWISRNGNKFQSSNKHYLMRAHYGSAFGGWLVHDNIDSRLINLRSWYNRRSILSHTDIAVAPEPISSTLFLIGGATLGFRRFRKKFSR